jgi:hypothetical protein
MFGGSFHGSKFQCRRLWLWMVGWFGLDSSSSSSWKDEAEYHLNQSQQCPQAVGDKDKVIHNGNAIGRPKDAIGGIGEHGRYMQSGGVACPRDGDNGRQGCSVEKDQIQVHESSHQPLARVMVLDSKANRGQDGNPKRNHAHDPIIMSGWFVDLCSGMIVVWFLWLFRCSIMIRGFGRRVAAGSGSCFVVYSNRSELLLKDKFGSCQVEPNCQEKARSIGKKDKQILKRVGDVRDMYCSIDKYHSILHTNIRHHGMAWHSRR